MSGCGMSLCWTVVVKAGPSLPGFAPSRQCPTRLIGSCLVSPVLDIEALQLWFMQILLASKHPPRGALRLQLSQCLVFKRKFIGSRSFCFIKCQRSPTANATRRSYGERLFRRLRVWVLVHLFRGSELLTTVCNNFCPLTTPIPWEIVDDFAWWCVRWITRRCTQNLKLAYLRND